ncbi:PTS transporter subunit EIIC [Amphibacillus jilinensis]|uniref:PTS transporter subunit EIIC n=1 Tax=Amphibacillus jilinensis TaxID=1216008 RepID=UPI00031CF321|nr:PTS transporter subunit EIIC [Amphibacillus jilinensis]
MDHKKVAKEIVETIGGQANVNSVFHCITRLRFKLKDNTKPEKAKVEAIEGVISVIEQGGQYQVVIGNEVEPVFKEVERLVGDQTVKSDNEENKNQKLFDRFSTMISGVFTPMLGILVASGLMKGLVAILSVTNLLTEGSDTYIVLNALGDALFYFFPIFLGSSAAKYFGMNHFYGVLIATVIIYPDIVSAAEAGESFAFLGIPMNLMNYTQTVFPIIVAVWLASLIERQLQKLIPQAFKYFLLPFVLFMVVIPTTLFIVGPVIQTLSSMLADLTFTIYNFSPAIAGLILGGPWIVMVMFGLHWAFIPLFINNMVTGGYDDVIGLLAANQFAMAAAAFAIGVRMTSKKEKSLAYSTGLTCLLGISEPALYGILLPRKKPLIMAIIAGSIGGVFGGLLQARVYAFTASGFFAIPGAINPAGIDTGFWGYVGQMPIGFIVAFVLTYFWGYKTKVRAVPRD